MQGWSLSGGECTLKSGGRQSQKRMQRWSVLKVNAPSNQVGVIDDTQKRMQCWSVR